MDRQTKAEEIGGECMNETITIMNELAAAEAFDKQAPVFDDLYGEDEIIRYKRQRVRDHVLKFLSPASSILELNAGTGEDAIYFAKLGHCVHATDISVGMQLTLKEKVAREDLGELITQEQRSYTDLENLYDRGPYDHIFSNFAGLNCTEDLEKVLHSFNQILKPGGHVTLVILPRFCLWELLLVFKGKFKTAFRRLGGRSANAKVEGRKFKCWYYNPSFIKKVLAKDYEPILLEGLCCIVPPSYIEGFAEKHPRIYKKLVSLENCWKYNWPWRSVGDYYILTLRKRN